MPVPFQKPWLDYAGQIALLEGRGLAVADRPAAEWFLSHVNYYRFSGYCLAFEPPGRRHAFVPGTTFEQVKAAYDFDFALRDLLSEALEIIEVDLRTAVAHRFGEQHGAFGHTDPANFHQPNNPKQGDFQHQDWLGRLRREVGRSKELFVTHLRGKYTECQNRDLPVWVATEVMSFGALSTMIKGMTLVDQRAVARRHGVQPYVLTSWAHHLTVARNTCAHHCRVWDRTWSIKPRLPAGKAWRPPNLLGNERVAVTLLILYSLLKRCLKPPDPGPANRKARVDAVLAKPPAAPAAAGKLGINEGWVAGPLWK